MSRRKNTSTHPAPMADNVGKPNTPNVPPDKAQEKDIGVQDAVEDQVLSQRIHNERQLVQKQIDQEILKQNQIRNDTMQNEEKWRKMENARRNLEVLFKFKDSVVNMCDEKCQSVYNNAVKNNLLIVDSIG